MYWSASKYPGEPVTAAKVLVPHTLTEGLGVVVSGGAVVKGAVLFPALDVSGIPRGVEAGLLPGEVSAGIPATISFTPISWRGCWKLPMMCIVEDI